MLFASGLEQRDFDCTFSFSKGMYFLVAAGFSFGGTLSFEVASQLKEHGDNVAMVIMLDTLPWFPESLIHTRQFCATFQELQTSDSELIMVMLKL